MLTKTEEKLLLALEPHAQSEGIEIVTIEVVGAKKSPTVRIYIDCEGGVSFDVISKAQAWINDTLDAMDPFPGAYMLEVSSPGIDRPLRTREHFSRFAGDKAMIQMTQAVEGRARWTGILQGMEDDNVMIEVDGTTVALPFDGIKRAHVIGEVDFSS